MYNVHIAVLYLSPEGKLLFGLFVGFSLGKCLKLVNTYGEMSVHYMHPYIIKQITNMGGGGDQLLWLTT